MADFDIRKQSLVVFLLILIDQLIKNLTVGINSEIVKTEFLDFSLFYAKNFGVAYGLFSGLNLMIIFTSIIILVLLIKYRDEIGILPFILIFSGGFSNLIDRIFYGFVHDMFYLRVLLFEFNIFNFADVLISLGIILILCDLIRNCVIKNK